MTKNNLAKKLRRAGRGAARRTRRIAGWSEDRPSGGRERDNNKVHSSDGGEDEGRTTGDSLNLGNRQTREGNFPSREPGVSAVVSVVDGPSCVVSALVFSPVAVATTSG